MGTTLNKRGYNQLLEENVVWLKKQTMTLERDHTIMVLEHLIKMSSDKYVALYDLDTRRNSD